MKITRVSDISKSTFIDSYLTANTPVIITDGMKDWDITKFEPPYLDATFGNYEVQVYDDLFKLQTIEPLHDYLSENFNKQGNSTSLPFYIRWYTKLKNIDFYWADEVFEKLSGFWSQPYFLPNDNLVIPYTLDGKVANVNEAHYPYRGLFISCKGARTRLHKDPFNSNAILCQFYGEKKISLYPPQQESYLMNNNEFVDIKKPDLGKFPAFSKAAPVYEDVLSPGEIVLFPAGWFHDVTCISDSISITWNFVHYSERRQLSNFIAENSKDSQLEVLQFFLADKLANGASLDEMTKFLQQKKRSDLIK